MGAVMASGDPSLSHQGLGDSPQNLAQFLVTQDRPDLPGGQVLHPKSVRQIEAVAAVVACDLSFETPLGRQKG